MVFDVVPGGWAAVEAVKGVMGGGGGAGQLAEAPHVNT